ncbi:MAG: glycosyltransferase family 2 protein, partial [Halobacteriaceae archaeon]
NKDAGLATCLVVALTPDEKIVHCETDAPRGDCSESMLIGNQIGSPSRVLVRQECFDDIGTFDESLPTKQDWDLYLRLCQEWDITAIEDHLCFRMIHESMSSSTHSLERDKKDILQKHENLIRSAGVWEHAQASVNEEIGRSYLGDGRLKKGREYLRSSLSDVTVRRLILFSLSYTHPNIVSLIIGLKRKIARSRSNCSEISITSADIPGLRS